MVTTKILSKPFLTFDGVPNIIQSRLFSSIILHNGFGGVDMNGYISVREAAERWDISKRQVQKLCLEGRIAGVARFSNAWVIPEDTTKPTRTAKTKPGPKPKRRDES